MDGCWYWGCWAIHVLMLKECLGLDATKKAESKAEVAAER